MQTMVVSTSPVTRKYGEAFYDVPNQPSTVPLALHTVCIRNQQILLQVTEDLVDGTMPLLCGVDARVSLRPGQRGIHMSRIEHVLQTTVERSLADHAVDFAERIRETQQQEVAEVRLTARVPHVTRTPVTGLASPDTVEIRATGIAGPSPSVSRALAATNITACPCMQGYALTDLVNALELDPEQGLDLLRRVPIATHSQRGRVELAVKAPGPGLPGYHDLYHVLAEHTTLTQELLKRPDEYELVRRAHLAPQFVEDVVRDVASGLIQLLAGLAYDQSGWELDVVAESHESIHGHDILARLSAPATELAEALRGS